MSASVEGNSGLIDLQRGDTRVAASAFVGLLWTGTCLSLFFVVFRIFVRIKVFRKLFVDDYLVIGAWTIMFANAIIWQTQYKIVYQLYGFYAVGAFPDAPFLTCLWAVKLSFLVFFRRLGSKVNGFTVWWWIVFGISIATWLTCIGDNQWDCSEGNVEELFVKCSQPAAINFEWTTLHYNCAMDIITDAMNSYWPKLALLGLFSLTIITIVFSIIRVAVVTVPHAQANIIWLAFWGNIEMPISVTVACLGSFRQLFVKQSPTVPKQRPIEFLPTQSENLSFWRRGLLSHSRKLNSSSSPNTLDTTKLPKGTNLQNTSFEHIISIPLHSIQVTDNYEVEIASGSSKTVLKPSAALTNPSRTVYKSTGKGNGTYRQIDEPV